jgi:WD40 repeat protein
LPPPPFKGLAPFQDSDLDAGFFFGREREREVIEANLMASRLTILYGEPGVGKSSVLRAGLAHHLRTVAAANLETRGEPGFAVVVFDAWKDDPVQALRAAVAGAVTRALGGSVSPDDGGSSLADTFGLWQELLGGDLYVILDQTEEYFLYHGAESGPGTFREEFPAVIGSADLRANFLLAIREDALAKLDAFRRLVPGVLDNYLRLEHLDRRAARTAIIEPIAAYNARAADQGMVSVEPGLVDAVLDQVVAGKVEVGSVGGRGSIDNADRDDRIETPYLQLVMRRIWDEERALESPTLRLETLRRLGGAEQIVRDHVELALASLSSHETDIAANLFDHLVTPSGAKIAQDAGDLAQYAGVPESEVLPVLSTLGNERILRSVIGADPRSTRYEIFHDVLAEPVLTWRAGHELERERVAARRERRRLWLLVVAAFAALLVVGGVAVFALVQRGSARSQARRAHAHELAADALTNVSSDPVSSVALALQAAQLSPEAETEDVLRTSLLAMRELHVLRLGGRIVAASFAPSGGRLLAASSNGTLGIFDTTGTRVVAFPHQRSLTHAVWSPDGRFVATGDVDGLVTIVRARDGQPLRRLDTKAPVASLAFTHGTLLAGSGGRLLLIHGVRGSVRTLRLAGAVVAAAQSPNGKLVAVATERAGRVTTRILDAQTRRVRTTLPEHGIDSLRFDPTGRVLVTGSTDKTTRLWLAATGRLVHELPQGGYVLALSFSPDGQTLATASSDGSVPIWDVRSGVRLVLLVGSNGSANDAAFSPDGKDIAVAFGDRAARVYDATDGRLLAPLAGDTDSVTTVGYDSAGDTIVTGSDDGTVRLWSANAGDQLAPVDRRGATVRAVFAGDSLVSSAGRVVRVLTPGGRRVAAHRLPTPVASVAAQGTSVAAADTAGDLLRTTIGGPTELSRGLRVTAVAYEPDGTLITGSSDGTIRLWSSSAHPRALPGSGAAEAISAGTGGFAVLSRGGAVHVYTPEGALVRTIPARAGIARLSPDGTVLATARAREADLWSTSTGKLLHRLLGHTALVTDVEFSPDGRTIVTASVDHDGRLWDTASGQLLHVLRGHFFPVRSASFSPDGRWVVTASQFTAGLWSVSTGRNVLYLEGNTEPLTGAVFSSSDNWIATGSNDGTVRVIRCDICADMPGLEQLATARLRRIGATSS